MWEPEPDWHPLPGGTGTSTVGVWRAAMGDQPVVVKRLARPARARPRRAVRPDALRVLAPRGRRPRRPASSATPTACGRPPPRSRRTRRASPSPGSGSRTPPAAGCSSRMALGRFAGSLVARPRFLARHQLRDRLARVERRGGWPTLARTPVADVADHLWRRRESMLERVEALPQVPQHGDPAAREPPRPRARPRRRHRLGDARRRPRRRRPRATTRWPPARSSSRCSRRT